MENYSSPILRNLKPESDTKGSLSLSERLVWEISIPKEYNFYWAIFLAYLFMIDDKLSLLLKKLKKEFSSKKLSDFIELFNPFFIHRRRKKIFHQKTITEAVTALKFKLDKYGNDIRTENSNLNKRETNLHAAADILECQIEVYFPDENMKKEIYLPNGQNASGKTIVIFQHRNRENEEKEQKDIFRFGLSGEYEHRFRLEALYYILGRAKLKTDIRKKIIMFTQKSKYLGKNFLNDILENMNGNLDDVLPNLYQSPYIALKLSEAGFETNPTKVESSRFSPFELALMNPKHDTKFFRILYDYAVNCIYPFDKTVRNADENILSNLQVVHAFISERKANLHSLGINEERICRTQNEFLKFNKYQQRIVSKIKEIQKNRERISRDRELKYRKDIIISILKSYIDDEYYYYDPILKEGTIYDTYKNYLKFKEYYDNIDSFTGLLFFDNLHPLKKVFPSEEDIFSEIESTFFHLVLSNNFFSKLKNNVECQDNHDNAECEKCKNTLQLIPLFFRQKLKSNIKLFEEKLSKIPISGKSQGKRDERKLFNTLSDCPEIRDEFLINKLNYYLSAALEVSFDEFLDNENKDILRKFSDMYSLVNNDGNSLEIARQFLPIERFLQILGESVLPQTTEGCVVSCLLNARLSTDICTKLVNIRNELSHCITRRVRNRLNAQKVDIFNCLQDELRTIKESVTLISFTQYTVTEEYLLTNRAMVEYVEKSTLPDKIKSDFRKQSSQRLDIKNKEEYSVYKHESIKFSLDIITQLKECVKRNEVSKKEQNQADKLLQDLKMVTDFLNQIQKMTQTTPSSENLEKQKEQCEYFSEMCLKVKEFREKYSNFVKQNFDLFDMPKFLLQCPALHKFVTLYQKGLPKNSVDNDQINDDLEMACYEASELRKKLCKFIKTILSLKERRPYQLLKALQFMLKFLMEKMKVTFIKSEYVDALKRLYEQSKKKPFENISLEINAFHTKYSDLVNKYSGLSYIPKTSLQCPGLHKFESLIYDRESTNSIFSVHNNGLLFNEILIAVRKASDEASASRENLIKFVENGSFEPLETESHLKRLIANNSDITYLRKKFKMLENEERKKNEKAKQQLLTKLEELKISKNIFVVKVEKMLNEMKFDEKVNNLLIKLAYQSKLKTKIYASVNLNKNLCKKLRALLTFKIEFLKNRIFCMHRILIDKEISEIWMSEGLGPLLHMKFLMRQRLVKEKEVRASLEMAFFDCLNILDKADFKDICEKLNNLFTGINIRNVLAHGNCVLEVSGDILDKDDLPSEFINKMLDLIFDIKVIRAMQIVFLKTDIIEQENFKKWIKTEKESYSFRKRLMASYLEKRARWENYLVLFPLV